MLIYRLERTRLVFIQHVFHVIFQHIIDGQSSNQVFTSINTANLDIYKYCLVFPQSLFIKIDPSRFMKRAMLLDSITFNLDRQVSICYSGTVSIYDKVYLITMQRNQHMSMPIKDKIMKCILYFLNQRLQYLRAVIFFWFLRLFFLPTFQSPCTQQTFVAYHSGMNDIDITIIRFWACIRMTKELC